jgi:hypothetical protein
VAVSDGVSRPAACCIHPFRGLRRMHASINSCIARQAGMQGSFARSISSITKFQMLFYIFAWLALGPGRREAVLVLSCFDPAATSSAPLPPAPPRSTTTYCICIKSRLLWATPTEHVRASRRDISRNHPQRIDNWFGRLVPGTKHLMVMSMI